MLEKDKVCKEAATALHVKKLGERDPMDLGFCAAPGCCRILSSTSLLLPQVPYIQLLLGTLQAPGVYRDWETHLQRAHQVDISQEVSALKTSYRH